MGEIGNDDEDRLTLLQSPIHFEPETCIVKHFTPFHFAGYNEMYTATITYTEHAIRVNLSGSKILPTVCGGGLVKEYVLKAIEFRWDAEHVIDDNRYPLEAQLIHFAKRYDNYDNALNYKDGIAIFSTFFMVTAKENAAFENLIQATPVIETKINQEAKLPQGIVPRDFLAPKICKYYSYVGSLTTPCYNETVIWTIFSVPSHISDDQLEQFTSNWMTLNKSQATNCRKLHNINCRNVYLSVM